MGYKGVLKVFTLGYSPLLRPVGRSSIKSTFSLHGLAGLLLKKKIITIF